MLSAAVQASGGASAGGPPEFDSSQPPTFTDPYVKQYDDNQDNYKFGLLVTDENGQLKPSSNADAGAISVEPHDGSDGAPKYTSSFLYLRENGGIEIDQDGRSATFKVKHGDGLTIGDDHKLTADTVELTVTDGKVTAPGDDDKKKLVNAGDLSNKLNELGWRVSANGGAASTVKSGNEVEFKGEGGITVTSETDATTGKHTVTIKAAQPQGGAAAGGSTPVTAGDGISVSAGNKVSVKPKDNGGLTVGTDGVSVNTDGATITVDTATGNVSAVTGAIENNAGNAKAKTGDEAKLTTVANVAKAINDAKVKVEAGNGAKVEHNKATNTYTVSADLPFTKDAADKSITLKDEGVIRNVANGRVAKDSKDAVNGSQLHAVERRLSGNMDKLNHRIDKMGKRADAGTASAIATANLLQSYRPGLSAATAAVGQYHGQSAVAVGYSRLSDNGKYGVKFSLGANTQGNVGAGAGVAYFW